MSNSMNFQRSIEMRSPNRFMIIRNVLYEDELKVSIHAIRRRRLVNKLLRYHRIRRTLIRVILQILMPIVLLALAIIGIILLGFWLHSHGIRRFGMIGFPIGLVVFAVWLFLDDWISDQFDNRYLKVKRKGRIYE